MIEASLTTTKQKNKKLNVQIRSEESDNMSKNLNDFLTEYFGDHLNISDSESESEKSDDKISVTEYSLKSDNFINSNNNSFTKNIENIENIENMNNEHSYSYDSSPFGNIRIPSPALSSDYDEPLPLTTRTSSSPHVPKIKLNFTSTSPALAMSPISVTSPVSPVLSTCSPFTPFRDVYNIPSPEPSSTYSAYSGFKDIYIASPIPSSDDDNNDDDDEPFVTLPKITSLTTPLSPLSPHRPVISSPLSPLSQTTSPLSTQPKTFDFPICAEYNMPQVCLKSPLQENKTKRGLYGTSFCKTE